MLKFGNKEFRNLQEQVEENMKDIEKLKSGQAVLDEFGIKVVGEVESIDDLPTVSEYKEETPDWEYGDAYAVGTEDPYTLYILTRANGTHEADYWFDIGVFPAPGPQGEQGPTGETGPQGPTGPSGADGAAGGFGTPTATVTQYSRGINPTVSIEASGPNTEKVFAFAFGIPSGAPNVTLTNFSGTLTAAQLNILHTQNDSVITYRTGSGASITFWTLQRWYETDDYLYFICPYTVGSYQTNVYTCRIDRSSRAYVFSSPQLIKVDRYNISSYDSAISANATAGKVLTADGSGGTSWETAGAGMEVVSLTSYPGTLSDADYTKLNGDNGVIKYTESSIVKYFKKQSDDGTYIYYFDVDVDNGTWWGGFKITKSNKYYNRENTYLNITNSNIKTGSLVAGQFLKSNGSGGSTWGDPPSQVQADWNQTSQSSPAYIKNKPTIPTVDYPVTDIKINGNSIIYNKEANIRTNSTYQAIANPIATMSDIPSVPVQDVQVNGSSIVSSGVANIIMPTIPVTDVKVNGTSVLNNKVAEITVPTKVSDLQNDSGYTTNTGTVTSVGMTVPTGLTVSGSPITSSGTLAIALDTGYEIPTTTTLNSFAVAANLATVATSGDYDDLLNKPTIPDTSHMVTDNTAQTITGTKTFNEIDAQTLGIIKNNSTYGALFNPTNTNDIRLKSNSGSLELLCPSSYNILLRKTNNPTIDLYGLVIPSTSSYTANKTIATTDDIPVVPTNISSFTNDSGYITGINSSDVTTALGFTPLANTACTYQTTAPTAAIADGGVHIVYLSSEPATKYSGYIYMIAEA